MKRLWSVELARGVDLSGARMMGHRVGIDLDGLARAVACDGDPRARNGRELERLAVDQRREQQARGARITAGTDTCAIISLSSLGGRREV